MPGGPSPGGGQPPFGSSPATMPTQNLGFQAAGMARVQLIIKLMEQTVPLVGAASELGKALLTGLQGLAKHVQPGTVSPAQEQNSLESLRMRQMQMAPQLAALRQQGAQPGPAIAPPPGGPPPSAAA